jgi:hypothetical protein
VEKHFVSGAVLFVFKIVQCVLKKNTNRTNENHLLILLSTMHMDVRYRNVRDLIKAKSITEFGQIFDSIPKSVLARALRKNTSRMDKLIEHPEELSYKDIKTISSLLDVPCSVLIQLFDKDFS